jgi:serine/threonine-protein kinase PknG
MSRDRCNRNGCSGDIEEGYCNVCGLAALKSQSKSSAQSSSHLPLNSQRLSAAIAPRSAAMTTGTGSSPLTNRSKGSRRTTTTSARSSRRQLGAGLISVPELPSTEPEKALLLDPKVPENKRFCSNCNNALRREQGFCSKCGGKYCFTPSLKPGDVVAEQYEVKGALAYGGLGWIYLGFDRALSRYVVLKGLLNTEDASSAAVAVAERQFLAAVKHSNIVGIYNFVSHGSEGFIVMEYVGGQTLKEIRKSRGVLPVTEAIAYIHRILSAFSYLHQQGLVYCDFKPDNIMLEGGDVKLIDMGGVRRIDDLEGDIYGTVGYSAPEAGAGPTIVSDLYTIGRTLAVLITNIPSFGKEHQYTLPNASEDQILARQESLYRFLLKATAYEADDRFQSADEMAEQLLGVLREIVAIETQQPRPFTSQLFNSDRLVLTVSSDLLSAITADYQQLPLPLLNTTDPAFHLILNAIAVTEPAKQRENLHQIVEQVPTSREAWLQLANTHIALRRFDQAEQILTKIATEDPWEWRVLWYRGRSLMAQKKLKEAQAAFDQVYFDLPGELAPKLALALTAEQRQNYQLARQFYEVVGRTDPNYLTAIFGLARCYFALNDRQAVVATLERVPQTSSLYARSRIEIAQFLIRTDPAPPGMQELKNAALAVETITTESLERYHLTHQVFATALKLVTAQALAPSTAVTLLGQPLEERALRQGLEKVLRSLAHLATGAEKIRLVDEANRVRPRTLF